MKIRPLQDRIVVKRLEEERRPRAGSSSPTPPRRSRSRASSSPWATARSLKTARSAPVDVKVGDKILFGKYSGTEVKIDGEEHLIIREDDILGVIES
jgi:chaperonin GroES